MRHIIYRFIANVPYYWNTCGWSTNLRIARVYTHDDVREAHHRMSLRGVRCMIAPFTARAGMSSR